MGEWLLADTFEAVGERVLRYNFEEASVRPRSLQRTVRPQPLVSLVKSAIADCSTNRHSIVRNLVVRGTDYVVAADPLLGPEDTLFGVHVWFGKQDQERSQPPATDAFVWDRDQWTLLNSGVGGAVIPPGNQLIHGAWFLSRILECEERDRLTTLALEATVGSQWEGSMIVSSPSGETIRAFGFLRVHEDGLVRGLVVAVPYAPTTQNALLPTYRRDAAASQLGGTIALIDLETAQILEWLTPPLPGIAWRHHPGVATASPSNAAAAMNLFTSHLVHPDDRAIVRDGMVELATGGSDVASGNVRILTVDGDYTPVEVSSMRLPNGPARFITTRFRPLESPTA